MTNPEFSEFPKMARLSRECIITEKIDGTNAQIYIDDDGDMHVGSRNKWISPANDNAGFARWVEENKQELFKLGPGKHFGEWWGLGIQRRYDMKEKRFSLFNVSRWDPLSPTREAIIPSCVSVVPTLYKGIFDTSQVDATLELLRAKGSYASPGFMKPEGVVVYHIASGVGFKKTLEKDEMPKSLANIS